MATASETSPLLNGSSSNSLGSNPDFGSTKSINIINDDGYSSSNNGDPETQSLIGDPHSRHRFLLCLHLTPFQLSWAKTICGYLLIITAGLLFTLANVLQKIVAPDLFFWHLLAYRAAVQLVVMFGYVKLVAGHGLMGSGKHRFRIVLQGLLGGCLLLCIFIAVKLVPLGNASAIFFCTPVFTFLFAVCMLRERLGLYRVFISALMLTGVVLITRPPFIFHDNDTPKPEQHDNSTTHNSSGGDTPHRADEGFNPLGYLCAVAVPLLSAVVSVLTRQLRDVPPSVLMLWFGVGAAVVSVGGLGATQAFRDMFDYEPLEFVYILGIIVLGIAGNVSYTFAVRWVSPSKGNVFRSFEVILNFVLQLLLEHTAFHFSNVVGIACLLASVLFIAAETEVMERYGRRFFVL